MHRSKKHLKSSSKQMCRCFDVRGQQTEYVIMDLHFHVNYCDCISCLGSHSDGTHSLQSIHW